MQYGVLLLNYPVMFMGGHVWFGPFMLHSFTSLSPFVTPVSVFGLIFTSFLREGRTRGGRRSLGFDSHPNLPKEMGAKSDMQRMGSQKLTWLCTQVMQLHSFVKWPHPNLWHSCVSPTPRINVCSCVTHSLPFLHTAAVFSLIFTSFLRKGQTRSGRRSSGFDSHPKLAKEMGAESDMQRMGLQKLTQVCTQVMVVLSEMTCHL